MTVVNLQFTQIVFSGVGYEDISKAIKFTYGIFLATGVLLSGIIRMEVKLSSIRQDRTRQLMILMG